MTGVTCPVASRSARVSRSWRFSTDTAAPPGVPTEVSLEGIASGSAPVDGTPTACTRARRARRRRGQDDRNHGYPFVHVGEGSVEADARGNGVSGESKL